VEGLGLLCLVVVGLVAVGAVGAIALDLIGDVFEGVLDLIGPIGALIAGIVVIVICCNVVSSAL